MSTATGGRRPRWRWLNRPAMWLGHYQEHIILGAVALSIVDDILGRPGVVADIAGGVFVAWAVALLADSFFHQRQLCERCIREAPTLDPQGAVDRWRPALRCFHRTRMNLLLLGGAIAWSIGSTQIRHDPLWRNTADVLVLLVLAYSYFTGHIHRRLYPWCPWCRWGGGGGDDEIVPVAPEDHGVLL